MRETGQDNAFFRGFVIGLLFGGVLAGLMAPRSGAQTREIVREQGLELKDRAEDLVLRAQTIANETLARVQHTARLNLARGAEPDTTA